MSTALLVRRDLGITFTDEAQALKSEALEAGALIGRVSNAEEQENAVKALQKLKGLRETVEKARTIAKAPLLDAGRALDLTCRKFCQPIEDEWGRINDHVVMFQFEERRRIDREKEAQEKEVARIEAERVAALKTAQTAAHAELINQSATAMKEVVSQPIQPTRAEGQIVKDDWDIQIINPYELAKWHPDCVKIEALLTPIKTRLNQGMECKGIKATKKVVSTVRTKPQQKLIEV